MVNSGLKGLKVRLKSLRLDFKNYAYVYEQYEIDDRCSCISTGRLTFPYVRVR